ASSGTQRAIRGGRASPDPARCLARKAGAQPETTSPGHARRGRRRRLRVSPTARAQGRAVSFLVDTNVLSELRKGKRADPRVVAWFADGPEDELFLSVIVAGELRQGIERLRRRDLDAADRLDRWLICGSSSIASSPNPIAVRRISSSRSSITPTAFARR